MKKEEDRRKKLEYIKIKEWEDKFDMEKKAKELKEIRKEQNLYKKENEIILKFEEPENQSTDLNLELKDLDISKSTKN